VKEFANGKFTPPHTPQANGIRKIQKNLRGKDESCDERQADSKVSVGRGHARSGIREEWVTSGSKEVTPTIIAWSELHPRLNCLRVIGSKTFAYNFDGQRKKFNDKAKVGIFVGDEEESAVYIPHERKMMRSGHEIVCEKESNDEAIPTEYDFIHELAPSIS
jgi:hypothetical protein